MGKSSIMFNDLIGIKIFPKLQYVVFLDFFFGLPLNHTCSEAVVTFTCQKINKSED